MAGLGPKRIRCQLVFGAIDIIDHDARTGLWVVGLDHALQRCGLQVRSTHRAVHTETPATMSSTRRIQLSKSNALGFAPPAPIAVRIHQSVAPLAMTVALHSRLNPTASLIGCRSGCARRAQLASLGVAVAQTLSTADLVAVVRAFRDALVDHRDNINRLNVYPGPDGDTGTNMTLTLDSVLAEVDAAQPGQATGELAVHGLGDRHQADLRRIPPRRLTGGLDAAQHPSPIPGKLVQGHCVARPGRGGRACACGPEDHSGRA